MLWQSAGTRFPTALARVASGHTRQSRLISRIAHWERAFGTPPIELNVESAARGYLKLA
jgi:hypothetical protein